MIRLAHSAGVLLLAVLGACNRSPDVGPYNEPGLLTGPRCRHGDDPVADARRHIRERRPHVVGHGSPMRWACASSDPGLAFESLGCMPLASEYQYADAYNAVVLGELRAGRLEEFRVKAREMSPDQVRALFADGGGIRLEAGSPPLRAPGGRYEVVLEPWPTGDPFQSVWVVDRRSGQKRQPIRFGILPA
ncbi:MAG TPA: hypothetical protein VKF62_13580, partial [Planctomycetota bacterium]|nr:hypothetical protein [Planctomycetota bacterium]